MQLAMPAGSRRGGQGNPAPEQSPPVPAILAALNRPPTMQQLQHLPRQYPRAFFRGHLRQRLLRQLAQLRKPAS